MVLSCKHSSNASVLVAAIRCARWLRRKTPSRSKSKSKSTAGCCVAGGTHSTCSCHGCIRTITAPSPSKLIPKSRIGTSLWVHFLLSKFAFYQPIARTLQELEQRAPRLALGHGHRRPATNRTDVAAGLRCVCAAQPAIGVSPGRRNTPAGFRGNFGENGLSLMVVGFRRWPDSDLQD